jgi:hypothetical protein
MSFHLDENRFLFRQNFVIKTFPLLDILKVGEKKLLCLRNQFLSFGFYEILSQYWIQRSKIWRFLRTCIIYSQHLRLSGFAFRLMRFYFILHSFISSCASLFRVRCKRASRIRFIRYFQLYYYLLPKSVYLNLWL